MSMLNSVNGMDVAKAMSVNKRMGIGSGTYHVVEMMDEFERFSMDIVETSEKPNRYGKLLAASVDMGQAVYSLGSYSYVWNARQALVLAKDYAWAAELD